MGVGFPTKANWAAGDVLTAAQLDDLAATVNLLQTSAFPVMAGKNAAIGGSFDVWQRGTTFASIASTIGGTYTADRWIISSSTTGLTQSCSQQPAQIVGSPYALRFGRVSGQTSLNDSYASTTIESANVLAFAGKQITVSVNLRKGADGPNGGIYFQIRTGTGTDQGATAGLNGTWTGYASNAGTIAGITTSSVRYTQTFTVPSTTKEIQIVIGYTPTGTAGANEWIEIEQVQLELGSVATTFSKNSGSIAGELSTLKRYFRRFSSALAAGFHYGIGRVTTATTAIVILPFDVEMRVLPTLTTTNITGLTLNGVAVTAIAIDWSSTTNASILVTVAGGLTVGAVSDLQASTTASALDFNAEL